jgi:hypothetical protein
VTDDRSTFGLGALPDPPDERDYPISALYAADGVTASVVLPASYVAPGMPPVLDQHATPMCVAYSSSAVKAWQDRRDQERFFDFDEPRFFSEIGGTAQGAYVRAAMERMRTAGYPVAGAGDPAHHRIAAYYAVPRDLATIKAAILDLGPIVVSTTWYRSWFHPVNGGSKEHKEDHPTQKPVLLSEIPIRNHLRPGRGGLRAVQRLRHDAHGRGSARPALLRDGDRPQVRPGRDRALAELHQEVGGARQW